MVRSIFLIVAALGMSACSHTHHRHISPGHVHYQHRVQYDCYHNYRHHSHSDCRHHVYVDNQLQFPPPDVSIVNENAGWRPPPHSFKPLYTHKLLSDYTEQITMKLVENMRYVTVNTPVAVASFVNLDSGLNQTNLLGNQLAESFITELQTFGIPVFDVKTSDVIHVGAQGDFVFSRDIRELNLNPGIKYVLSGTMTYNDRGTILNVRMVDLHSKRVVASTKGFLPHFITESIMPSYYRDGVSAG